VAAALPYGLGHLRHLGGEKPVEIGGVGRLKK
jgi:hypothetical protein